MGDDMFPNLGDVLIAEVDSFKGDGRIDPDVVRVIRELGRSGIPGMGRG